MPTPSCRPTPRREFLGQLTASAIVLASSGCASSAAGSETTTAPSPGPPSTRGTARSPEHWDDSWFGRLTSKHKAVFDSPEIADGAALQHAVGYIDGMRSALAAEFDAVQTVVVIRHAAIPMVFNDAIWEKYQVGKERKVKDESTKKWAVRNPFIGAAALAAGSARTSASTADGPSATLTWMASHNQTLLGCGLATRGYAGIIAAQSKADPEAVYQELKANLVPGVLLQPTGVYAVHRAQEAGCTFIRST